MFKSREENLRDFVKARYGLFIHYGLYSLLGRGEWCLNREMIDIGEYKNMAEHFTAENFDADRICALAKASGMRYICLTTMHHDGFMLYDSDLSDFCTTRTACGRDLVQETIAAARKYGLRVHLYHSLNQWTASPDAVAALENKTDYERFIQFTFARIKELVTKYNPIDVLWYDGWWPFNAEGWQAEEMNRMVLAIQPWILFNGRNGLPGDFTTPEGHMSAPNPWRPWEACLTLNDNWCYVKGDENWKSPSHVIGMLLTAAKGNGNMLLGIGPEPDGSIPPRAEKTMREVALWLEKNGEAVYDTDVFDMGLMERGNHRSDWSHIGDYTASGNNLFLTVKYWSGSTLTITGLKTRPQQIVIPVAGETYAFDYNPANGRLTIRGLPNNSPGLCPMLKIVCSEPPEIYRCGGMHNPKTSHPPYDPCPSDLKHS
jgi:alpha-L-fucosidase